MSIENFFTIQTQVAPNTFGANMKPADILGVSDVPSESDESGNSAANFLDDISAHIE